MLQLSEIGAVCLRHVYFLGPGLVNSVAYIDPGNYATDLQAGALFGDSMQFVVLIAGLTAVLAQVLALRLGAVTGEPLAVQTRLLFERLEARYPRRKRLLQCCLWALYLLAEIAIIATDLAELIGCAIALNLLFPALPLWGGVILTTADVLVLLLFFSGESGRKGMLAFEIVVVFLVVTVFASFVALQHLLQPRWGKVFFGLLPSKTIFQPGALYDGIGIVGATIMPHALYLGSFIATADRLDTRPVDPRLDKRNDFKRTIQLFTAQSRRIGNRLFRRKDSSVELAQPRPDEVSVPRGPDDNDDSIKERDVPQEPSTRIEAEVAQYQLDMISFDRIRWTDLHIWHGTFDTTFSLIGFALTINASILTVAATAYYYDQWDSNPNDASIQGAFALIGAHIGRGPAIVFAIALLCAGQSASITVTLAGQAVSEGFIKWKTSPVIRRLVTRLIGVIPSAIVAAAVGPAGLNTMLVASQVALSLVLPFALFPLVWLCANDKIMTISNGSAPQHGEGSTRSHEVQSKSYKSPVWLTVLGYLMFVIIVLADGYVIVELGRGVS